MGIYNDLQGCIKIQPKLSEDDIDYFRGRFCNYILSLDWKQWAEDEDGALRKAKCEAEKYIKPMGIGIDPYRGVNESYLNFLAKMFGERASGTIKIVSSTTYGDTRVNGGWTNDETIIEFKDGKVNVFTNTEKSETCQLTTLHIGGNLVQYGKTIEDLSLLKYIKQLKSLGYYHDWKLNDETIFDTDVEGGVTNLSNNIICYCIPYHDGYMNNFLFIKGGLVTTLNPVNIHDGVNSSQVITETTILNEKYSKDNYKIINLSQLKQFL